MLENAIWMLILMGLTAGCGLLLFKRQPKRLWLIVFAELAMICHFILTYVIFANGTEAAGTDGLIYHQVAKDVARQLWSGTPLWAVKYEYTWYTVMVGIQYALFGVNRFAASFVNSFLAVLSGYLLTDIALKLNYSFKKAAFIGNVYLFIPSMLVWTTDTRKESLSFFISILLWYLALRIVKEREWSVIKQGLCIGLVCVLLYVSTLLRIYMLYTLGGGLLVGLFFHYLKTKRSVIAVFGVTVLIACIALTFTMVLTNLNDYHALPMDRSQGGDEDLDDELESIIKTIIEKDIPRAVNGFLTRPHLEEVDNITDISGNYAAVTIVRIEQVLWYICMILAIFGFLNTLLEWDPYLLGLIAFIVSYTLINALISENVADTYYRYRAAIIAPMLLFADYRPVIRNLKTMLMGKS